MFLDSVHSRLFTSISPGDRCSLSLYLRIWSYFFHLLCEADVASDVIIELVEMGDASFFSSSEFDCLLFLILVFLSDLGCSDLEFCLFDEFS